MRLIRIPVFILFILLLSNGINSCSTTNKSGVNTKEGNLTETFQNPVLDRNFPDPTVVPGADGYYYAYGTNTTSRGELIKIQVVRSKDLVTWEGEWDAMPKGPEWAGKDFWAPHVLYDKEREMYYLYYSAEYTGEEYGKCLGVATSKSPLGPFKDTGKPLLCGEGFVNIDPMAFDDPDTGKKLLYWGSGFESIKVRELDDTRTNFKKGSSSIELLHPFINKDPQNYERLIEGVWIDYSNGYFYLYYSGDNCCGDQAHYAVMVARSRKATGPFERLKSEKKGGNVILERNEKWLAPGHNSIIKDDLGQDWIIYHAIDSQNPKKGRVMLIDLIQYRDQWPFIKASTPSNSKIVAPVIQK